MPEASPIRHVRVFDDPAEAKAQKQFLAVLLGHFAFIQLLYSYYLDHNAVIFVPRCLLLTCLLFTTWLVSPPEPARRAAMVAFLHSPAFILHLGRRPPSIFLNFLALDDTASVPRLLAMDCGVLLLLVALANVRHSIVQDRTEPDCFQLLPFHAAGGDGESSSDGLL
eukprot:EG_transcript_21094